MDWEPWLVGARNVLSKSRGTAFWIGQKSCEWVSLVVKEMVLLALVAYLKVCNKWLFTTSAELKCVCVCVCMHACNRYGL